MVLFEQCGLKIERNEEKIIFSGDAVIDSGDSIFFDKLASAISEFRSKERFIDPFYLMMRKRAPEKRAAREIKAFNPPTRKEFEEKLAFHKSWEEHQERLRLANEKYRLEHPEEYEDEDEDEDDE